MAVCGYRKDFCHVSSSRQGNGWIYSHRDRLGSIRSAATVRTGGNGQPISTGRAQGRSKEGKWRISTGQGNDLSERVCATEYLGEVERVDLWKHRSANIDRNWNGKFVGCGFEHNLASERTCDESFARQVCRDHADREGRRRCAACGR